MTNRDKLLTVDGRAREYRHVLRLTVKRLVDDFARKLKSPEPLPESALVPLLNQIHVNWAEMCRYSQMVIGDYALLMEDEAWATKCMREAMETAAAVSSSAQALLLARDMRSAQAVARPDAEPRELVCSFGKVTL